MSHIPRKNKLLDESYKTVSMLMDQIANLPDGYAWLYGSLPVRGRASLHVTRKKWAHLLYCAFLPRSFLTVLLSACFDENGIPNTQGKRVYTWLLEYVYAGNVKRLYTEWCEMKKRGEI